MNGLGFVVATGYASAYDSRVVGLQTYEKERILAGNRVSEPGLSGRYIERCFYYDSKGRLIQRVEQNHLGGVSRYHYAYDFVGNVTSECETHTVGGVTTSLEKVNNYDHVSRLLGCKVYLNGVYKGKVDYEYDALGRLSVRRYGENAVTETLSYDIRGRLTEQGSSFFRLGLRYENAQKGPGLYGGDISEWSCRYGSKAEQLYTFSYDGAGRFTGGNHYENGVLVNKYVEQGIGYDKNGNILSLKRYSNGVLVDNLTYSYNGNSLSGLTESAVVASGDIYERKNVSGGSYDYDIYGNLSKDSRKNLNFEYNILNLLHNVREGSIIMAGYEYSYGGVKLKVWGSDGNGYAYVGNLVYRVTGSSFVFESGLFGEGVVSSNGICYHLKDHLGSIRAIVDGSGRLLEENDYYAFGHRHPRSEHAQSSANRFKYNGKELQTVGGLGYLDYGARMYDQSLGRWFTTDPLSEKYYGLSPYVYCGNNPLNMIDPDGRAASPYYDSDGFFLGTDEEGFRGTVRIVTGRTAASKSKERLSPQNSKPLEKVSLSAKSYSRIYTDILKQLGYDVSLLDGGEVAVKNGDDTYNDPFSSVEYAVTTYIVGNKNFRISVDQMNDGVQRDLNTVEHIENVLGVHEYTGHGIRRFSEKKKTHYMAYELQFKHASWKHCTPLFRGGMLSRYYGIVKKENPERYRQMRPFILKYWYK